MTTLPPSSSLRPFLTTPGPEFLATHMFPIERVPQTLSLSSNYLICVSCVPIQTLSLLSILPLFHNPPQG